MEYKTKVQIDELKDLIDKFGLQEFDFRVFDLIESDIVRKTTKKRLSIFGTVAIVGIVGLLIFSQLYGGIFSFLLNILFMIMTLFGTAMCVNIFIRNSTVQNMIDRSEFAAVWKLNDLIASNLKTLANIPGPWRRDNLLKCLFILENGTTEEITPRTDVEAEMAKAMATGYTEDATLSSEEKAMIYHDIAAISKELSPEEKQKQKENDFATYLNKWILQIGQLAGVIALKNSNMCLPEFLGFEKDEDYNIPKLKNVNNEKMMAKVSDWIKNGNGDANFSELVNDLYNFDGWAVRLTEKENQNPQNDEIKVKSLEELNEKFLYQEKQIDNKELRGAVSTVCRNIVKLIDVERNYKTGKIAIFKMRKIYLPYLQEIIDKYIKIQNNTDKNIDEDIIKLCNNISQAISEKIIPDIISNEEDDLKADTVTLEKVMQKDGFNDQGVVLRKNL